MSAIDDAIGTRFEIEFVYGGHRRVVQPAAHGLHKDTGKPTLRGYQVAGASSSRVPPLWSLFSVESIQDLVVTDRHFPEDPPDYTRDDKHMRVIFSQL